MTDFIAFTKQHPELFFYVTRIGCGIAGFRDRDIAPLFAADILTDETYAPGACTPLYDAVGRTLTKLEKERHAHEMWSHEMDAFNRATPCATIEERVCFNAELTDEYYDEEPKKKRPKKG